ncbi:MAG: undecaprenyl/decaprenyl-phosphate alpha-N-acetylglucosaminyl 1-phosphate transferase [Candidatus Hydrogenedentes bacterium]|nr:undecaprenyl/decaprenyl-phosphate alpha-N-acetylglucosaminyl 1-phosphate transferase [Candidatus Hydrogenedentota bacterium]
MTAEQPYLAYAYLFAVSALLAAGLTAAIRPFAMRLRVLDHPGERKVQPAPVPLLGGAAIVGAFYAVVIAHLIAFMVLDRFGLSFVNGYLDAALGDGSAIKLAAILAGGLVIFALGLADDLRNLSPPVKLAGQIAAASLLVFADVRIELFVLSNPWISGLVTIFWVVLITNAMNFLDNMDGLCGGVSVIAAFSFFLCVVPFEPLVRYLLLIFAGVTGGFLYHNLSPARIYMGDAGALFCGYFLATIAVLGTFHVEGTPRIAVAAPLLALAVPLFDMASVLYLRWRQGQALMRGDRQHFSHRLVDLGMSPRQAVEFIFLVAAIIGLGGAYLPLLDARGTILVVVQTVGVFLLIVLLMRAGGDRGRPKP